MIFGERSDRAIADTVFSNKDAVAVKSADDRAAWLRSRYVFNPAGGQNVPESDASLFHDPGRISEMVGEIESKLLLFRPWQLQLPAREFLTPAI
jgi:hypothetical protein